jgi:hypothetical protein
MRQTKKKTKQNKNVTLNCIEDFFFPWKIQREETTGPAQNNIILKETRKRLTDLAYRLTNRLDSSQDSCYIPFTLVHQSVLPHPYYLSLVFSNPYYLFLLFETALGLKVNLAKSNLIHVGTVDQVGSLAGILGCGFATLLVKYLGLLLGASYKSIHIWDGFIEKIEHRLANWKRLYISKGGKVTLIKSTLTNLPTYFLSLFPLPTSVVVRIKKLQLDFLWGGIDEQFKYHLVSWSKVCAPISEGGLGIKSLVMFSCTLLGKWLGQYGIERDAWWRVATDSKFANLWGGWCSLEPVGGGAVEEHQKRVGDILKIF